MILDITKTYHRKNQILYDEDNNEILKFRDKMPDGKDFSGKLVENMNNYIRCYPERIEKIEPKQNVQLNLF